MLKTMLDRRQRHTLKERAELDRKREEEARRQRRKAKAERAARLRSAERGALRAAKNDRAGSRLGRFHVAGGVHQARSGRKAASGPPENKALSGPPENKEREEWPHKMPPHVYLKLNPDGPSAPLARRILARD